MHVVYNIPVWVCILFFSKLFMKNIIFRQLSDAETSTFTYIIADLQTKEAAIIDPVLEQVERDAKYISELGLTLKYILDTHVHADHITAASSLKKHFPAASYALGKHSQLLCADILLEDNEELSLGAVTIRSIETPGHTDNSVSYLVEGMIFTGDALLIRGCGRTDFQSGDNHALWQSIKERVFTLPEDTLIYPGHDYKGFNVSSVWEEKRLNPRLKDENTEEQFVQIMDNLNLPYPKKIDASLPANMLCGVVHDQYVNDPVVHG